MHVILQAKTQCDAEKIHGQIDFFHINFAASIPTVDVVLFQKSGETD